ncbi:hypothetical protein SNOG_10888 [Parastagonospora nodorum SN15]|uniref:Uncharacterized protein n=1 Tax=Phaeosphaeria nodorum (strain SN15 / ATCC MYA-4574 / FGSC 10173) TaxID=321614 RepID=Q0UBH6_PHANO|nr:hypothetical protein SNOG_10888 [Parastagonospora nodorum SN15]EAT81387.1 hypothetical protein SNOG_10888 [Parastagonospora nodorum SN15]
MRSYRIRDALRVDVVAHGTSQWAKCRFTFALTMKSRSG